MRRFPHARHHDSRAASSRRREELPDRRQPRCRGARYGYWAPGTSPVLSPRSRRGVPASCRRTRTGTTSAPVFVSTRSWSTRPKPRSFARGIRQTAIAAEFSPESVDPSRLPSDFDPSSGIPGCAPTGWLEHGDRIDLGGRVLEVFHTPGHSPGGVSFLDRRGASVLRRRSSLPGAHAPLLSGQRPGRISASRCDWPRRSSRMSTSIYPGARFGAADARLTCVPFGMRIETVWAGRAPDRHGTLYGYRAAIHEFERFSFQLCRPDD